MVARMDMMAAVSFEEQVDSIVAERHLLRHPFYVAWSKGELSRDQLRQYAGQYLHHVLAEPTYLSAVHSNTPHFTATGRAISVRVRRFCRIWSTRSWGRA